MYGYAETVTIASAKVLNPNSHTQSPTMMQIDRVIRFKTAVANYLWHAEKILFDETFPSPRFRCWSWYTPTGSAHSISMYT